MTRSHAISLALGLSFAVAAIAAPTLPQAAVARRQAGFKQMGSAFKALNEQLRGSAPNASTMANAARVVNATAREQGKLFPAGSGPGAGVKTDALPAIWSDRATFDADMAKLVAESGKLTAVAGGTDIAAIRAQAKVTGATCASCHRQFRSDS